MKRILISLFALSSLALVSCSGEFDELTTDGNDSYAVPTEEGVDDVTASNVQSSLDFPSPEPAAVPVPEYIIKTGHISITVADYALQRDELNALLQRHQGYIADQNEVNSTHYISNTLKLRLPSAEFDSFFEEIDELAEHIDSKQSKAEDVSAEFIDVEARIEAKKAVEARYLDILERATTIEEILKVENQIRVIREELESAQARLKFLSNRTSYSTVNLSMTQNYETALAEYEAPGFWDRMGNGLESGWDLILLLLVGLAHVWPFIVLTLIGAWLLRRLLRRSKARLEAARAAAQNMSQPPAYNG